MQGNGLRDRAQELADKNAVVLGASFDTQEENRAFAEKFDFPFPLLCDTDRSLGMAYGACSSPTAPAAARIAYIIGPDGTITHVWPKANPATFPTDVLAAL